MSREFDRFACRFLEPVYRSFLFGSFEKIYIIYVKYMYTWVVFVVDHCCRCVHIQYTKKLEVSGDKFRPGMNM